MTNKNSSRLTVRFSDAEPIITFLRRHIETGVEPTDHQITLIIEREMQEIREKTGADLRWILDYISHAKLYELYLDQHKQILDTLNYLMKAQGISEWGGK